MCKPKSNYISQVKDYKAVACRTTRHTTVSRITLQLVGIRTHLYMIITLSETKYLTSQQSKLSPPNYAVEARRTMQPAPPPFLF